MVENLNAEMVGGFTAQELLSRVPAEAAPGPPGPQGPQGPPGPPGAGGPSAAYYAASSAATTVGTSPTNVLERTVPPGLYVVMGKVGLVKPGSTARVRCWLRIGVSAAAWSAVVVPPEPLGAGPWRFGTVVPLFRVAEVTSDQPSVALQCQSYDGDVTTRYPVLVAIPVLEPPA